MLYIKKNNIEYSQNDVNKIMHDFNISELTSKIILSRGIKNYDDIMSFFDADSILSTPNFSLLNMQKAVDRIEKAMTTGEKIAVYGDYDVDGICGVSIVINVFKDFGYDEVIYYIPDRIKEGYGINIDAVDYIKEQNCSLIITVDCGISNIEEVEYAKKIGIDVIITDHHVPPDIMPDAVIINPQLGNIKDAKNLCGASVAMKLMCALFDDDIFNEYCDFAAIASIADMAELIGENRKIVKYGLKRINEGKNKNIKYLVDECIKDDKTIKSDDIAYYIAPAINAAGRIDKADKCVDLFIDNTEMPQEAAAILAHENYNRRNIEKAVIKQAVTKIKELDLKTQRAIILFDERWHPGVLGIAASKIKNTYFRPVILLTSKGDMLIGSARSIEGIDMHKAIKYCSHLVKQFGGHFMAAGLIIDKENLNKFKLMFENFLSGYDNSLFTPLKYYDVLAGTNDITLDFIKEINLLAPFGKGNPSPSILLENINVKDYKKMGNDNNHFRCQIDNGDNYIKAVAFSNNTQISYNQKYNAIISAGLNEWKGRLSIQAQIHDIKLTISDDEAWFKYIENLKEEFDLTLSQCLYLKESSISNKINTKEVIKRIKDTAFGALILILDINAAKNAFNLFGDIINTLDIITANLEDDKLNFNTMLIAPDIKNLDLNNYDEVYILTSYEINSCFKSLHDQNKMYIISDINKMKFTYSYIIDLERLRKIYLIVRNSIVNNSLDSIICGSDNMKKWEIHMALKIFEEVNLLNYDSNNKKYTLTNIKKVDIEKSSTYQKIKGK